MLTRKMAEEIQAALDKLREDLERQRLEIVELQGRNENELFGDPSDDPEAAVEMPIPENNFKASKIPDAIKMIVPYHGDPKTLATWIRSVEEKVKFASEDCPSERDRKRAWPLWIRDKRDLSTLVTNISYLEQGAKDIVQFYKECRELLSDITAKISIDRELESCARTLTGNYENMIMNSFIDGLNDPYSTLTRTSQPKSLLEAYQNTLDQFNANQRKKQRLRTTTHSHKITSHKYGPVVKYNSFSQSTTPNNQQIPLQSYSQPGPSKPFFKPSFPQSKPQLLQIKADPSTQTRQNRWPYPQRQGGVNYHEAPEEIQTEEEVEQTPEEVEDLNFCLTDELENET
ncbi:uncharacterized protein LOC128092821 [Culex pipiens pallens]|uniref:uncharacterized protein LOC128092820 n=1 Tax=Culex pipiens pallens TaxID=42434 RepID=UPI0022AAF4CC|nr:uncharacterized protein LOC128092820 [Culex pipiens pallens]XP_052563553.1 uncharacterized protein LOC128092821 [Culex pipiens pallens]